MTYEDPDRLRARLRLGREEYCQRLLTMLILGGAYPRWNTRSTPSAEGLSFLQQLDDLAFGEVRTEAPSAFIDECDLPPRHDAERGCAPDYAVEWQDRLWMIELKTEARSHRRGQLQSYFELARHHHPGRSVDLLYLTPAMQVAPPEVPAGSRYAHLLWEDVAPLIQVRWGTASDPVAARLAAVLLDILDHLDVPWIRAAVAEPEEPVDVESVALARAQETALDGVQRAVELEVQDLDALHGLRLAVRDMICASPDGPLHHVRPWLWSATTSGGRALTITGAETGYELRLSRYRKAVC